MEHTSELDSGVINGAGIFTRDNNVATDTGVVPGNVGEEVASSNTGTELHNVVEANDTSEDRPLLVHEGSHNSGFDVFFLL